MTIHVEIFDEKKVFFNSENWYRDADRIKMLPGARYSGKTHRWTAPLSWATCKTLRGIFGEELEIGESLRTWAYNEFIGRVDPSLKLRMAYDVPVEAPEDEILYPFQRAGVKFLTFAKRALLLDEMGTGKTVQSIRTLRKLKDAGDDVFPAIVICPKNMMMTWRKEIHQWWPGRKVAVVSGSAKARREALESDAEFFIINYENVRTHSRLAPYGSVRLKRCHICETSLPDTPAHSQSKCEHCKKELNKIAWHTVIVDEAHRMKDPRAKQTRGVWALRTDETIVRLALTGTAIANAPHDLWPALYLIAPEEWPSRGEYIDRYCLQSFSMFGPADIIGLKPEMREEYFSIVDPRMRRMPKAAVLTQLPKKTYTSRYVDMPAAQSKAYKQLEEGMIARLDEGLVIAANPLVQLTRLSQFASSACTINDEGNVVMKAPSNKVDTLVEILEEMGEKSAVVFAESRQLIELAADRLRKEGVSFEMIVGGQTLDDRQEAMEHFQAGHSRVILCTIAAGGVGITLTKADTAIFLQRSWSMVNNSQAEDRVHRIGSEVHESINIVDIISIASYEERQREVLGDKLEKLEEVMRDRATIARILGVAA